MNHLFQNNKKMNSSEAVIRLMELLKDGKFLDVINEGEALIKEYPSTYIIWNMIGEASVQIGMLDKAVHAYNKSIKINPDYADTHSSIGLTLKMQGKLNDAIIAYKKSISIRPDNAHTHSCLGNAFQAKGMIDEAIISYKKAISLNPDFDQAYNNLGIAFLNKEDIDQALIAFNKALSINKNFAEAHNNLSNVLMYQSKLDEAISHCKVAISLNPNYSDAYCNLGRILNAQGKLDEAIFAYNKVIAINPKHAIVYNNIGLIFQAQGKYNEALSAFKKAITIKTDFASAYNNMGNTLQGLNNLDEAIFAYKKAISLNPNYADAYNNMGVAFKEQGDTNKAIKFLEKSVLLKPNFSEAFNNLGLTYHNKGQFGEAIEFYNKSISLDPHFADARQNLSFTLLHQGKLKEGLDVYEWRWKTNDGLLKQRHFSKPLWDGNSNLNNKRILIWCEQGLGDTITWSSYLPNIFNKAEHCILECQEKLVPLLKRSFPTVEVKVENKSLDLERNDFDFHLPTGSLYRNFLREISQNTKVGAFLLPDSARVKYWKERLNNLGKGPYIGISWKSSKYVMSRTRMPNYADIIDLLPVIKMPEITFINLQYEDFERDLGKVYNECGVKVHNFDNLDHFNNLDDVAALTASLDMVVSTKNTVPFISAGVGTPTLLANWRQSSWNNFLFNPKGPMIEIFERNTWEPWDNVFQLISKYIRKNLNNK